jgi:hypothetical protein
MPATAYIPLRIYLGGAYIVTKIIMKRIYITISNGLVLVTENLHLRSALMPLDDANDKDLTPTSE